MLTTPRSRFLVAFLVWVALAPGAWAVEEPIPLRWEQLVPPAASSEENPDGLPLGDLAPPPDQADQGAELVTAYNGKRVRIPGFVVPLTFEDVEVKEFLLVPYVGACIHVPPPPANQIVHVQSGRAVTVEGMFTPIWVTGTLVATPISTGLAEVGYRLTADDVEPWEPKLAVEQP
jgi:hypothetical protein